MNKCNIFTKQKNKYIEKPKGIFSIAHFAYIFHINFIFQIIYNSNKMFRRVNYISVTTNRLS